MRKLNIGCGTVIASGWVNADNALAPRYPEVAYADLTDALPWPDGEFSVVVANHVMQHIDYPSLDHAFSELHRVTAPGGVLRVLVPDVMGALNAYLTDDVGWFHNIVGNETTIDGLYCTYLTWFGTARTVFTMNWLHQLCLRAGYVETATRGTIYTWSADACELDSRLDESIIMEARKA